MASSSERQSKSPYFGLRGARLHAAIWTVSCVSIMIFGYNQGSAGNVLTLPSFYEQFPQMDTVTTHGAKEKENANIQGTVIALYTLFGVFGALGCTFLGDVVGRRWTIFLSCAVQAVGCILMGTAFQFAQFIIGRIVLGLGTGGIIATVSVWQAETAKAHSRGEHVSSFGIFCGLGLVVCLWLEFGCSFIGNSAAWRLPLAFPAVFSAFVMATVLEMPESPRWLVKMGRSDEAAGILSLIHDTTPDSEQVRTEVQEIQLSMELNGNVSLSAMFKMGRQRTLHRVILAAVIQVFLQMSGTNAVISYTTTLFGQQLGFSRTLAYILSACLQFTLLIGSSICAWTVDRFGRRPLLMLSAALAATAMACLTGTTSDPQNTAALKAGTFFVFMFETCYCLGFLGIPFLYASEIAPVHLRASVCGLSTAISWLINFLVVEVTPIGLSSISYRYFIVFASTNAAAGIAVFFFYPETAGRSLEEIDEIFVQSKNIFDPVRIAKTLPRKHLAAFLEEEKTHDPRLKEVVEHVENVASMQEVTSEKEDKAIDKTRSE